jgi:hypothetical protein
VGDVPLTLSATASSGLPVTYTSSNSGVVIIEGNIISIVGAGTATISALQDGNENYTPAVSVMQSLSVRKKNQSIIFLPLPEIIPGERQFTLTATSTSGLPLRYTSNNLDVATIHDFTVEIVGAGETIISAFQDGNNEFDPATPITNKLVVKLVTGIEPGIRYAVNAYPNPATEYVFIETADIDQGSKLKILDVSGKFMKIPELLYLNKLMFKIDISDMSAGIYYLQIDNGLRCITKRIVKK